MHDVNTAMNYKPRTQGGGETSDGVSGTKTGAVCSFGHPGKRHSCPGPQGDDYLSGHEEKPISTATLWK